MQTRIIWLLCILLLTFGSGFAIAQVGTQGSILGTVTDATGAAVPGAEVVATNLDTGLTGRATTDQSGNFEIFALPIGRYSISASAQGFKTWKLESTNVTVGERSRIAPTLAVGEVTEQISVEASAEL